MAIIPNLKAQQSIVKNFSAGFRIFEYDLVGNNPTTISPQLKEPVPYLKFLSGFPYNSLYGNPAIAYMKNIYLNVELQGRNSESRFWKNNSIQAGIVFTNKLTRWCGKIENIEYDISPDYFIRNSSGYSVDEEIQFLGVNGGINRRFKLSRNLKFLTGLQVQGSFAIVHTYNMQLDSIRWESNVGWTQNKSVPLPSLQGKNYFQWQAIVPLGLEINLYKHEYFVRLEAFVGLIDSSIRLKSETNGVGIWFIYQPGNK